MFEVHIVRALKPNEVSLILFIYLFLIKASYESCQAPPTYNSELYDSWGLNIVITLLTDCLNSPIPTDGLI